MTHANQQSAPQAIILAAGKGTRMGGDLPKVLYAVAGRPMVSWVVDACIEAGASRCIIVIGYRGELVRTALAGKQGVCFVEQTEQLGTGHAARMAEPLFKGEGPCDVIILAGDGPLIRVKTLTKLLQAHREAGASATLATATIGDPTGYGRIVRDAEGRFMGIVEHKDATTAQRQIREINPSYYCFRSDELFKALGVVTNKNRQGEYYLTDVPALLKSRGKTVAVVDAVPPEDVLSINTPKELEQVDRLMRRRLTEAGHQSVQSGNRA